jgi:hypothetical protein
MDSKQFIVELVQAIIWPLLIVFLVRNFVPELKALLGKIQQFNFRTGEISFDESFKEAREGAESIISKLNPEGTVLSESGKDELSLFQKLAAAEPAAAVMIAWKELERNLRNFYRYAGLKNPKTGSSIKLVIEQLVDADVMDAQLGSVLLDLWKLRNLATHAENHQISPEKSLDYARLCLSLSETLRTQQPRPDNLEKRAI